MVNSSCKLQSIQFEGAISVPEMCFKETGISENIDVDILFTSME